MVPSLTRLLIATLALLTIPGTTPNLAALACARVEGHLEERLLPQSDCTSPVGLCTVAQMFGNLKGEARFTASAFIASADTVTTGVVFVTGDTVLVNARFEGRQGTISIKNAAAFRTVGDGDLVDVQVITGGTDDFAGASGTLRIRGNFLVDSGTSSFEGTVCLAS